MNTTQAQQKALYDALVAPAYHLEFEFEDLLLEQDILSFIRDIRHIGDITYLTDVNVDYLHQPWRAFATVINKCLSSKETGMDKICVSHAQILWEKAPKPKYIRKKAKSDTSPKKKPVALTEAEQIKVATKRSMTQFYISHPSGLGDGVGIQSKVLDEQQQKVSGTNEGVGVTPEVPDVPKYDSESEEESCTFSQDDEDDEEESDKNDDNEETESDNDRDDLTHPNLSTYKADKEKEEEEKEDDDEVSSDQRVSTPPDYELIEEEEYKEDDDKESEQEEKKMICTEI
ncbi:hypothetical protein Tco_1207583 [Tanacetum coccineum]